LEVGREDKPAYEGVLETPNHRLVMRSVLGTQLLEMDVSHEVTAVKIWVNHPTEPDDVVVGVG
jgi:hypothetical protein